MKGVVFTTFLDLVETQFGDEVADRIIEESNLATGGAYTSVGTYDCDELIQMVVALSKHTDVPIPKLIFAFGQFLFKRFTETYPQLFSDADSAFDFLSKIHSYIHVEVKKLYPNAELPTIEHRFVDDHQMELVYKSSRPFADLAEGLIVATVEHFGEPITVVREDIGADGTQAKFHLTAQIRVESCLL
jgi:hypothetical protein